MVLVAVVRLAEKWICSCKVASSLKGFAKNSSEAKIETIYRHARNWDRANTAQARKWRPLMLMARKSRASVFVPILVPFSVQPVQPGTRIGTTRYISRFFTVATRVKWVLYCSANTINNVSSRSPFAKGYKNLIY